MPNYRDEPDEVVEIPEPNENEQSQDPRGTDGILHVRSPSGHSERGLSVPVWLQESTKGFRFKWVPLPVRKAARATVNWARGPVPPVELKIIPFFPAIQEAPIRLLNKYVPKRRHRMFLLVAFFAVWFLAWSLMLRHLASAGYIKGYGEPQNLWCGASLWEEGNGCGLNGDGCRPFSATDYVFKCPANCLDTHILSKHWVGNESHQFSTLVVGGPSSTDPSGQAIYRGDSFICQAAIHAGVISADNGGCGVVQLAGVHTGFDSTRRNGVRSFGFPSTFPRSYFFIDPSTFDAQCPSDSRWGIFGVTAAALVILSLFTTSPPAFFFGTYIILMFHVGLVSDPPNQPNFYELLSTLASKLLPASFVAVVLYRFCAKPLLTGLTAQIEKTVLYLGFCLIGALNNYTFAKWIPIERLTPHDLAQPGAGAALAIVITVIVVIVIGQIHFIRLTGNMPKYLAIYATMGLGLIILLALPGQRLRIHHYILGILFMPGTFTQTRACLAYQGLLLGFFINGIARWGFDSIIQTPAALGEASGGHSKTWWGSSSPEITASIPNNGANITFSWGFLPPDTGVDGVSILVNDVERWRGYVDEELYWDHTSVTLERRRGWNETHEPEFYRFAWMSGGQTGRYSTPGIWDEQNVWHASHEDLEETDLKVEL